MSEKIKEKTYEINPRIDFLKIISAAMVVLLHCTTVSSVNDGFDLIVIALNCVTRMAVPIFCGVSGYLLFFKNKRKKNALKKICEMFIKFLFWFVIYSVVIYALR